MKNVISHACKKKLLNLERSQKIWKIVQNINIPVSLFRQQVSTV